MSTLDMTDKAICAALSANTPLTHEQRAVLMTVVIDRARQDLDADRFRLLLDGPHNFGVFVCGPEGSPDDSISNDELRAALDGLLDA